MNRVWIVPFLAATLAGCGTTDEPADAPSREPLAVTSVPAALQAIADTVEAGGVVAARTTAVVASRIVAAVVSVDVVPGDRVRAGQRLVTLDSRDLDAQRRQAAAAVTALKRAAAAAAADRDAAAAALALAKATHERLASLHARRAATAQELDEAVSALRGAEARVRASEARGAELAASLDAARAAADGAVVATSFATLTAPFDGVVTEKLIEPGNLAAPGMPLLRVEDTRGFRLEVRIDESRAVRMARGDAVAVHLGASAAAGGEGAELTGRVAEIARAADAASHAVLVKIELPPHPDLRSGIFARARFGGGTRQALAVPSAAIVPQGQLSTLFVVTEHGRARMRVVRTGVTAGGGTEIVAGLAAGEPVIVAPPHELRDGDPVRDGVNGSAATGAR